MVSIHIRNRWEYGMEYKLRQADSLLACQLHSAFLYLSSPAFYGTGNQYQILGSEGDTVCATHSSNSHSVI